MEVFQKRLREARKEKSFTQQELGNGIFVSKQEICLYEKGKRTPPLEVMMRMANFLEVDFLWLIGMELKIPVAENRIVLLARCIHSCKFLDGSTHNSFNLNLPSSSICVYLT